MVAGVGVVGSAAADKGGLSEAGGAADDKAYVAGGNLRRDLSETGSRIGGILGDWVKGADGRRICKPMHACD